SMGHFSPRALAAAMSRIVNRRVDWPPYNGSGIPALLAGVFVAGVNWPWSAVIASSASPCAPMASPGPLMIAWRPTACQPQSRHGWLAERYLQYDDVSYRFYGPSTRTRWTRRAHPEGRHGQHGNSPAPLAHSQRPDHQPHGDRAG